MLYQGVVSLFKMAHNKEVYDINTLDRLTEYWNNGTMNYPPSAAKLTNWFYAPFYKKYYRTTAFLSFLIWFSHFFFVPCV